MNTSTLLADKQGIEHIVNRRLDSLTKLDLFHAKL